VKAGDGGTIDSDCIELSGGDSWELKGSATTWTTTSVFCKLLKFYVRDEVGEGEGGDDETEITVVSRAVRVAVRFTSGSPVWVRSAWVLGGTRRGGWVLGRFSLASERALLCGLSHRQSQQSHNCRARGAKHFFLGLPP